MAQAPSSQSPAGNVLGRLRAACPGIEVSDDPGILESHGQDWTRFRDPAPLAVAFPRSTDDAQALVRAALDLEVPIVPSGGRTGLSGGAVAADGELVISFDRMRRVMDFDADDRVLTVEAGMTTAQVQQVATEQGLYYPVSFASEGTSQIGGNIATNAGGIRVLRYGLTRDRVAGLTAVDGQGQRLELNRGLVKNASGYDLRHLLVGSEGTLALICEASLWLTDPPPDTRVMLLGLASLDALMPVFGAFRSTTVLHAFEFFDTRSLAAVRAAHELPPPLDGEAPYYAVLEFERPDERAEERALAAFEQALDSGWLVDGVLSQSGQQADDLWRYREGISEAISPRTPYKNDLSVRISRVPGFLAALDELVGRRYPDFEVAWFGHIGDGNLHMNVLRPKDLDVADFEAACRVVNDEVYALVAEAGGSISAEHGIGLLKKPWLASMRSDAEIAHLRSIKAAFDPRGILNPGKLIPDR